MNAFTEIAGIRMPPIIKKRGRPKLRVQIKQQLDIPKKKKHCQENKPVPFHKKTPKGKEKGIIL